MNFVVVWATRQFRYYNPRIGRFMGADPLDGDISSPRSLNKLSYVGNNPVNASDPLGLYYSLNSDPQCLEGGGCIWESGGYGGDFFGDSFGIWGCDWAESEDIFLSFCHHEPQLPNYAGNGFWDEGLPGGLTLTPPTLMQTIADIFGFNDALAAITAPIPGYNSAPIFDAENASMRADDGKSIPNVPASGYWCSRYSDGTRSGPILNWICLHFPDFPSQKWSSCVRGKLRQEYTPDGNAKQLAIYLFWDHPKDFLTCPVH